MGVSPPATPPTTAALPKNKDWRTVEHFFDQIDHGWQWVQANAPDQIIDYVFAV